MSDIRKEIKSIDPKDPSIIQNVEEDKPVQELVNDTLIEEDLTVAAIDDQVINGSTSMLLEEAQNEADEIIRNARELAAQIQEESRQKGFDMGYEEGLASSKDAFEEKELALKQQSEDLIVAYEEKVNGLEPQIALIIRDLVEKMVGRFTDEPDVVIYLIKLALSEITTYGSFIVKVSPDDFDHVLANKDDILEGLSERIDVEILRDAHLEKNQCLIETDLGNVDASLQVRLGSLLRELQLISDSLIRIEQE